MLDRYAENSTELDVGGIGAGRKALYYERRLTELNAENGQLKSLICIDQ